MTDLTELDRTLNWPRARAAGALKGARVSATLRVTRQGLGIELRRGRFEIAPRWALPFAKPDLAIALIPE
jgi:hypothetical protein